MSPSRRVVVVANRLPVAWDEDLGDWAPSPGGLVSALTPILERTEGLWVGWSGIPEIGFDPFSHSGIRLIPVELAEDLYLSFYVGFCNGTLWPLYHDFIRTPEFHRHWWTPYHEVNSRFADTTVAHIRPDDVVWVQDYQLQLVPAMIRERARVHRIGFYLHIPFPPLELFAKLPWRRQVIEGLLGADVLSFQSRSSRTNFSVAARRLTDAEGTTRALRWQGREVQLQVAPIGIDTAHFEKLGSSPEVQEHATHIRSELDNPDSVILGVDRLDYTKGIDLRMRAIETLFERHSDLVGNVSFVQIAVPSRQDVEEYQRIRRDIEGMVGRINGDLAEVGRPPIHYMYRSFPTEELVGYYRVADVMLVTPLRDGMNLVSKEYVATRFDNTGVLVLSEFAGAAEELSNALVVNPHDLDSLADTLGQAVSMEHSEQAARMKALRRTVASKDVFWWANRCLQALGLES
jgi:trehalose 6-phosphate synthase